MSISINVDPTKHEKGCHCDCCHTAPQNLSISIAEPKPVSQNMDSNGVIIMRQIKQNGQSVTKHKVKRSEHDQSNEKNIKRDSIYGEPEADNNKDTMNFATAAYLRVKLSKPDQVDFKRCGGEHSKDEKDEKIAKRGRCYPIGIEITPGKPSEPFIAKEYPKHSDTPKFKKKIDLKLKTPLPDLNGKTFGLQTIGYVTPSNTYKMECYIDLSVLDKDVSELTQPPNQWQLLYVAEDDGSWVGEPYLKNQGKENDGDAVMLYGRVDHVTDGTKVKFAGAVEIVPPTTP